MYKFKNGDLISKTDSDGKKKFGRFSLTNTSIFGEMVVPMVILNESPFSAEIHPNLQEWELDEKLPEVDKSFDYICDHGDHLQVEESQLVQGLIISISDKSGAYQASVRMDVDDVLSLCHDLRRLALQVKRNNK